MALAPSLWPYVVKSRKSWDATPLTSFSPHQIRNLRLWDLWIRDTSIWKHLKMRYLYSQAHIFRSDSLRPALIETCIIWLQPAHGWSLNVNETQTFMGEKKNKVRQRIHLNSYTIRVMATSRRLRIWKTELAFLSVPSWLPETRRLGTSWTGGCTWTIVWHQEHPLIWLIHFWIHLYFWRCHNILWQWVPQLNYTLCGEKPPSSFCLD